MIVDYVADVLFLCISWPHNCLTQSTNKLDAHAIYNKVCDNVNVYVNLLLLKPR